MGKLQIGVHPDICNVLLRGNISSKFAYIVRIGTRISDNGKEGIIVTIITIYYL